MKLKRLERKHQMIPCEDCTKRTPDFWSGFFLRPLIVVPSNHYLKIKIRIPLIDTLPTLQDTYTNRLLVLRV